MFTWDLRQRSLAVEEYASSLRLFELGLISHRNRCSNLINFSAVCLTVHRAFFNACRWSYDGSNANVLSHDSWSYWTAVSIPFKYVFYKIVIAVTCCTASKMQKGILYIQSTSVLIASSIDEIVCFCNREAQVWTTWQSTLRILSWKFMVIRFVSCGQSYCRTQCTVGSGNVLREWSGMFRK